MSAANPHRPRRAALVVLLLVTGGALWWALRDAPGGNEPVTPATVLSGDAHGPAEHTALQPNAAPSEAQPLTLPAAATDAAHAENSGWPQGVELMQLSGRVLDSAGRPVVGAELRLLPDPRTRDLLEIHLWGYVGETEVVRLERDQLQGALSDGDGRFRLEAPWLPDGGSRPGSDARVFPQLIVLADGYGAHAFPCLGYAGGDFEAGDLVLERVGVEVAVRVVDPQGVPIPNVELSVDDDWRHDAPPAAHDPPQCMPVYRARSDAHGVLRSRFLWPGRLRLSFVHLDYDSGTERLELAPGERRDLGTLVLDPLGAVHGRVLNADGLPIVGAEVATSDAWQSRAWQSHGWKRFPPAWDPFVMRAAGFVLSDERGAYSLGGFDLRRTPYPLIAWAPGYDLTALTVGRADSFGNDFRLAPEASLRVRALDARDGSEIELEDLVAEALETVAAGAPRDPFNDLRPLRVEGNLVSGVGSGGTRLLLSAPGFMRTLFDAPGVRPGEFRAVDVPMQPGRRITVSVVDERGAPVPEATVQLSGPYELRHGYARRAGMVSLEATTDATGRAEFFGLPETSYWRVVIRAEGHRDHFEELHRTPEGEPDLEFELQRLARLSGQLFTAPGVPAVGVALEWDGEHAGAMSQVTDRLGRFRFESRPGAGKLRAPRVPLRSLELLAGEEQVVELVQQAPFVLTGQVRAGGQAMQGADVLLLLEFGQHGQGRRVGSQVSDAAGRFRFEIDHAREHRVVAWWSNSSIDRRVHAQLGGDEHIVFDFGAASLAGVVLAGDSGVSLAGLELTLKSRDSSFEIDARRLARDGRFRFDPLPPGSYDIHIAGNGCVGERWGPYELSDGAALDDVQLRPKLGASVSGRALRADGRPFRGAVHLRSPDREQYHVVTADYREGRFAFHGLPAGTWQLDLATFAARELGADGRGEPGAELPFFAREVLTLSPGEEREFDIVIPGAPP